MADLIERRTIAHVPESERHGTARELFAFWWGANSSVYSVLAGVIGIAEGLSLPAVVGGCVLGMAIGTGFSAFHAAQGPRLGLPQMLQARAQFGFFGALLPNALALFFLLGFVVGYEVLLAQTLDALIGLSPTASVAIAGGLMWAIASAGHRLVHWVADATLATSVLLLGLLVAGALHHGGSASPSDVTVHAFVLYVVICAGGCISWAPYVSDYTRYLPARTSARQTIVWTYIPLVASSIVFAVLGALTARTALTQMSHDSIAYLAHLTPGSPALAGVLLAASLVAGGAIGVYSPLLVACSCLSEDGGALPGPAVRVLGVALITAITCLVATMIGGDLVSDLADFTETLAYLLVPWSAISLADFYVARRGRYDVAAILSRDGRYGRVNVTTVAVYLVGVGLEVPFITSSWPAFTGPVARALGGVDLAPAVGFLLTAALYLAVAAHGRPASEQLGGERATRPDAELGVDAAQRVLDGAHG